MYWLIVVLEMNQRLKETTVLRVFFIKFINVTSQAVTERLYHVKERDSSCLWLCKSSWKTILNCKNLREDKEVKGQEVASVLTYKTAMEFENKKSTPTQWYSGESLLCPSGWMHCGVREIVFVHTDKTIEKERAKRKNDIARGDICRNKRQKSFY